MVRYFLFLLCIPFCLAQSRVETKNLFSDGTFWVNKINNKPFTGIGFEISDKTGVRIMEIKYLKGIAHGAYSEWYESGNKKKHGRFRKGEKNGRWVHYFENGQLESESNYDDGELDGLETTWFKEGGKRSKGCYNSSQKFGEWYYWNEKGEVVHNLCIETDYGIITINLFMDIAPMHAESFKAHANSGYYNGTSFHRVVPGFVIQGGDPNSRLEDRSMHGKGGAASQYFGIGMKNEPSSWKVPSEFSTLKHKRGIVSMARGSDKNSAGSQFFICVKDAPNLDNNYTIFGEVISGLEVIDRIVSSSVDMRDNPIKRVEMKVSICY